MSANFDYKDGVIEFHLSGSEDFVRDQLPLCFAQVRATNANDLDRKGMTIRTSLIFGSTTRRNQLTLSKIFRWVISLICSKYILWKSFSTHLHADPV